MSTRTSSGRFLFIAALIIMASSRAHAQKANQPPATASVQAMYAITADVDLHLHYMHSGDNSSIDVPCRPFVTVTQEEVGVRYE